MLEPNKIIVLFYSHKTEMGIHCRARPTIASLLVSSIALYLLILHINWTEYKHILCEKNVFFKNFVWRLERSRRTLAYFFQTNNRILMKFWHALHNELTKNLTILQTYQNLNSVSEFKAGDRTGFEVSETGLLKNRNFIEAQRVIFVNFISKSERCLTLKNIFQTTNIIYLIKNLTKLNNK